ncbi:hypothetical protein EDB89DRAFT_2078857 [Lactarius sanguifluus]|nr:hypothetical protein EDB89DRAFT_2078857 [Lactarius sanguifluus]
MESLKKHYTGCIQIYEEVKTSAAEALKEMAAYDSLEERCKCASSKAKKLKNLLQEFALQDEKARNDTLRSVQENVAELKSEKDSDFRSSQQGGSNNKNGGVNGNGNNSDNSTKIDNDSDDYNNDDDNDNDYDYDYDNFQQLDLKSLEKEKADQYKEELQHMEKALDGMRDNRTWVFHDQIEQNQKELQPWKMKINQKQAKVDVKTSEQDMLLKKAKAVEQASAEAHKALETVKSDQRAKIGELENLKNEGRSLQREANAVKQRVQDLTIHINQHRAQTSSTRQCAEEAKVSQAASTSHNEVLDSLAHLRDSGQVSGFHGQLRSLGTIPNMYDVAITTACGSLNNMVMDMVQQVKPASSTSENKTLDTPENILCLFDLVKPKEPWFAGAFYKALHDMLVMQDLTQATRIAFSVRRWRVVTFVGELIDSSGMMSGGMAKPRGGGMGSELTADAVPPSVLQKYEQDSKAAAMWLTEATEELREAEAELEAVGKSGPQIALKIDLRVIEAEKWVCDLKSGSKPDMGDLSRVAFLECVITTTQNELERLQSPLGAIEEAIKALERKILNIGGSQLLVQRSKVDGLKLHIDITNEGITKAEVAMAKAEKDLVKFEGSIASNRQNLQGIEIELRKLRRHSSTVQAEVENLKDEMDRKTESLGWGGVAHDMVITACRGSHSEV